MMTTDTLFDVDSFTRLKRPVTVVHIHCSASGNPEHDNVAYIRDLHVNQNGWADIGYHLYITFDGRIWNGRPLEKTPASIQGHNEGAIAICCSGLKEDDFTEAQMTTLKKICIKIDEVYEHKVTFHGHREFANKLCPVFDYKRVLDLDENGYLGANASKPITAYSHYPTLRIGSRGDSVFILQKLLGKDICDGIFGPNTQKAVMQYQKDIGLVVDGVVGPKTWAELL